MGRTPRPLPAPKGTTGPEFAQFDDGKGGIVPPPDASRFRNEPIRQAILKRLNGNANYRRLLGELFPAVKAGALIDFTMFGRAVAEFEFTKVFASDPSIGLRTAARTQTRP